MQLTCIFITLLSSSGPDYTYSRLQARIQRGVKGVEPPEKSTQKFLGLPFCGYVGHVQLEQLNDHDS